MANAEGLHRATVRLPDHAKSKGHACPKKAYARPNQTWTVSVHRTAENTGHAWPNRTNV